MIVKNQITVELKIPESQSIQESVAYVLEEHAKNLRSNHVSKVGEQQWDFGAYKISWDVAFEYDVNPNL